MMVVTKISKLSKSDCLIMPLSAHEFERRLIFYASPTLTKLKVACIYNLNDLDDLEECINIIMNF